LENIPDYKKMVDEELEKIQNKCLILSGILDGKTDRFEPDPTLEVFSIHLILGTPNTCTICPNTPPKDGL
jgi:hypothetical protein